MYVCILLRSLKHEYFYKWEMVMVSVSLMKCFINKYSLSRDCNHGSLRPSRGSKWGLRPLGYLAPSTSQKINISSLKKDAWVDLI